MWNISPFIETSLFVSNEIENIPDGTTAMAVIDDAGWSDYQGEEKIRLKWLITGGEFDGRTVTQNLKVKDSKESVVGKAMQMIAFLNHRTNRKLPESRYPREEELASSLIGVKAAVKIKTWKIDGKSGNYVAALGDKLDSFESEPAPRTYTNQDNDLDDDIPF